MLYILIVKSSLDKYIKQSGPLKEILRKIM